MGIRGETFNITDVDIGWRGDRDVFTVYRTGDNGQTYSAHRHYGGGWTIKNIHSGHSIDPRARIGGRTIKVIEDWYLDQE